MTAYATMLKHRPDFFLHAVDTGVMTVTLRDSADTALWSVDLEPQLA